MSIEPLRYGVVGLGRAGWNIHVAQLRPREDARIAAVVDPLAERREEAASEFGCKTYGKLGDMLNQDDVDVVVIATPSVTHGPDTITALKAGKHVVVEKPMSLSLSESDRMIQAARETGKKLFVHQNYRFFREFTHLKEVAESGKIGEVYHIRNYISAFRRRNDWQTLRKHGGGVLNNTCPHFMDQILQLLEAPAVKVMGDLRQIASAGDVEDHVKAFIRAENGRTADMEVSTAQNVAVALPKWILCGTHGTLTSDGKQSTIHYFDPKEAPPIKVVEGAAGGRAYGNEDALPWQTETVDAVGPDVGDFYDNVYGVLRDGGEMRVTPESVREVMRVIELIREGTEFPGTPN